MVRIHAAFITVICVMLACFLCMPGSLRAQEGADSGTDSSGTVSEYTLNDFYFDTVVSIRFDAGEDGDSLLEGCRSICDDIQHTFSRTEEDSELYAVNHRAEETVEVSEELARLVQAGLDYYELSDGRFDITVAPLSDLWDFKSADNVIPPEARIRSALRKVDGTSLKVEQNKDTSLGEAKWEIHFSNPDTMIDLGALVKGYAADRLADYLKEHRIASALINLGGNVMTVGSRPDGSAWRIGIREPFGDGVADTVEVTDQSVVSSGVYERCFEKDGVLYHHILDPQTGYPVMNGLWGVSIISDSSLTGDALSTTCLLIGKDEASELIRSMDGVRAVFVDDQLHVTQCG